LSGSAGAILIRLLRSGGRCPRRRIVPQAAGGSTPAARRAQAGILLDPNRSRPLAARGTTRRKNGDPPADRAGMRFPFAWGGRELAGRMGNHGTSSSEPG